MNPIETLLKGTMIILTMVILYFSTLSGTHLQIIKLLLLLLLLLYYYCYYY